MIRIDELMESESAAGGVAGLAPSTEPCPANLSPSAESETTRPMSWYGGAGRRPRLLFLRFCRPGLPGFIQAHLAEQLRCLKQWFEVAVVDESLDYDRACDRYEPDLVMFESGVYSALCEIRNAGTHPSIPRLGFIHCDAYCRSRKRAIGDMDRWGVHQCITTSVALSAHTPELAARLLVWPNFVDETIFKDYNLPDRIPVLFTGSQAPHYAWRNRVWPVLSRQFVHAKTPHFGWFESAAEKSRAMPQGEEYARLIASARIVPTCGTVALEVVRKHFEIPACKTVLLTEKTRALEAAGFVDGVNCVFATPDDVSDRVRSLLDNPDRCQRIAAAGQELVLARHTIRNRSQVAEWFLLQSEVGPRQRVVQLDPFAPMKLVEAPKLSFALEPERGEERGLISQGYADLARGNAKEALKRFDRANEYNSTAEANLGTALCHLRNGMAAEAIRLLLEEVEVLSYSGFVVEPDPVELSCLIVALLCRGSRSEAIANAARVPHVTNHELRSARRSVEFLLDVHVSQPASPSADTPSVHDLGQYGDIPFNDRLATLLRACGQEAMAARLSRFDALHTSTQISETSVVAPNRVGWSTQRQLLVLLACRLSDARRIARRGNLVAGRRLSRLRNFCTARLVRRSIQTSAVHAEMLCAMRSLQAARVLTIVSSRSSELGDLVSKALSESRHLTDLRAIVSSTDPTFTGFPGLNATFCIVTADALFQLANNIVAEWQKVGASCDLLIVDCSTVSDTHVCGEPIRAQTVVLWNVAGGAGRNMCDSYLATSRYRLVKLQDASAPSYAVLEFVSLADRVPQAASPNAVASRCDLPAVSQGALTWDSGNANRDASCAPPTMDRRTLGDRCIVEASAQPKLVRLRDCVSHVLRALVTGRMRFRTPVARHEREGMRA